MKKLTILLIVMTFALKACSQSSSTFDVPIGANKGVTYPDGKTQMKAWDGTTTGTSDFNLIINKPTFYPVDLVPLDARYKPLSYVPDYSEIKNKPATADLVSELLKLDGGDFSIKTTAEINALAIPVGKSKIVFDKTLGILKIWDGAKWRSIAFLN